MALRIMAARVLSAPAAGRPNLYSAAAAATPTPRLSPPSGGRPSRNLGGSSPEDAARKMVLETAATLERLEKTYELFKARVGLLEKTSKFLKLSWACVIPVPLVYTIAQYD